MAQLTYVSEANLARTFSIIKGWIVMIADSIMQAANAAYALKSHRHATDDVIGLDGLLTHRLLVSRFDEFFAMETDSTGGNYIRAKHALVSDGDIQAFGGTPSGQAPDNVLHYTAWGNRTIAIPATAQDVRIASALDGNTLTITLAGTLLENHVIDIYVTETSAGEGYVRFKDGFFDKTFMVDCGEFRHFRILKIGNRVAMAY